MKIARLSRDAVLTHTRGCAANSRRGVVLALALSVIVSGCASLSDQARLLVGSRAPESRLMLMSGEHIALRSRVGKDVALLFWATWCPHSRAGIEEFEALARAYKGRPGVEFYAVSVDKNEAYEELQNRIRIQNLESMTHVFSGNDVQDEAFLAFHGERLPYAVFIDEGGIVRFADLGVGGLKAFLAQRYDP